MKKWTKLFAVLALAVMLLLTACDDGTTGGGSGGTSGGNWGNGGGNTTGGGTDNTTTVKKDDKTTTSSSVFLTALNKAYKLPDTFDGWHLIVDDFDGDGRQEAYVFAGRPSGDQWYNISVFYVDPNGKITEILKNSGLYGAPQETKSTRDTSFASSCFRYKNQKFVSFWLAPQDGCVYSEVYGAYNGRATKLEIDGSSVSKTPEGFVYAAGLDTEYAYVLKNGRLVDMFTTPDAYKYVDPDYSMKTTPLKTAWKNFMNNVEFGNAEYFLQYDFDGDGRQEAYVFRGTFNDGYAQNAEIYYIGWGGTILRMAYSSGQLYQVNQWGYTTDDSMIKAGNQRFALWQIPGAGHAATRVFGARNGVPYEPQISGKLSYFHQEDNGRFYAESDTKYVDDEYQFNASTGEFYKR